jgi:PncC family amidohydrolase
MDILDRINTQAELWDIAAQVQDRCLQFGQTLSVAESCTGGLLGGILTYKSGSSSFFLGGIIAYSNSVKEKILGVEPSLLNSFGAVSREVAGAMAIGVSQETGSSIAISITGIAGPGGGTATKPVGTVCFGLARGTTVVTEMMQFRGNREEVRMQACKAALEILINTLN